MAAGTSASCKLVPIIPDGGWGWVVILGTFFIHIFSDGFVYSLGVLADVLLKEFKSDNTVIALIISLLSGIYLCVGPLASVICKKYGCRVTAIIGSCISIVGCAVSLLATAMWHIVISVGVIMGIGFGLMYCPAIIAVSSYFEKRRSLATGIAVSGAGVGTVIFSPINDFIIANYGWKAVFITFIVIFAVSIICGWTFRPLPLQEVSITEEGNHVPVANKTTTSKNEENAVLVADGAHDPANDTVQETLSLLDVSVSDKETEERKRRSTVSEGDIVYLHKKGIFHTGSVGRSPEVTANPDKSRSNDALHRNDLNLTGIETESHYGKDTASSGDTAPGKDGRRLLRIINNLLPLSLLNDPIFVIFATSNFLTSVGYNSPLYFLPLHATRGIGLDSASASKVLSVYGLCNTIGRLVFGIVADYELPLPYGLGRDVARNRLWMFNISLVVCGLLTIFSCLCTGFISLSLYAGLYGFSLASYIIFTSVVLVDLLGLEKLTSAFGLLLLWEGIGTFIGPPVAGYLADLSSAYTWTFIFCGINILAAGIIPFSIPHFQRKQALLSQEKQKSKSMS